MKKSILVEVLLVKGSGNLPKDSKVEADQIRTIEKMRVFPQIGKLGTNEIAEIERAIKIHFELP